MSRHEVSAPDRYPAYLIGGWNRQQRSKLSRAYLKQASLTYPELRARLREEISNALKPSQNSDGKKSVLFDYLAISGVTRALDPLRELTFRSTDKGMINREIVRMIFLLTQMQHFMSTSLCRSICFS